MKWLFPIVLLVYACNDQQVEKKITKTGSAEKVIEESDSAFQRDSTANADSIPAGKLVRFTTKYNFSSFKVKVFKGKLASPDFGDNDFSNNKEYVSFITNGCYKNAVNFAGHYTIIQKAGGAICEFIFIVDRINGKIFSDIHLNECRYGFLYKKDSKLLIANANSFQDERLDSYNDFFDKPELYLWREPKFVLLKSQ